jgi:two-component system response regulator WspF
MGRDGALGLVGLKNKGWYTIAQDEASCVVYGMPKAAKELGAAQEILALEKIAPAVLKCFGAAKR